MARQRKISTEELNNILNDYMYNNEYVSKLKYTELVEHAKTLGYNLIPNDFGRNKEIKEKIKKFNEIHKLDINSQKPDKYHYSEIDVERIIALGKKSINNQRILLQLYRENHQRANDEIIKLSKKIKEMEVDYQEILKEKNEISNQYKNLKDENNRQSALLKLENEMIKEERFIKYLNILYEKNMISDLKKEDIELMMQRLFKIEDEEIEEIKDLDINKEKSNITPINKNVNKGELTVPKMPELF